ncbi:YGGT family protein [Wolffia australiana]
MAEENCLLSSALRRVPSLASAARGRAPPRADPAAALAGEIRSATERIAASILRFPADFQRFLRATSAKLPHPPRVSSLSAEGFAAVLPGDSVAGLVVANGINNFLNIYNTLLVVRLVLTWFPNAPPAVVSPLSSICDPYLNIFRGIIPPLGGTLDLSPVLAFLVLNAFQSTAAALPAEMPSAGAVSGSPLSLTAVQEKWLRRVCRSGSAGKDQ